MPRIPLLVGIACALIACSKPKPKPDAGPSCGARVCGTYEGLNCGSCTNSAVCSSDQLSCRAALAIGSPCQVDLDCGTSPYVCLNVDAGIQAPDGYCSEPCDGGVACPSGSTCQQDVVGDSVCLTTCASDSQCRTSDGYTCGDAGTCQACVASCTGKSCGNDGCGGSCGITTPMIPACNTADQVCSAGACVIDFNRINTLPRADYPDGLWDATAVDLTGQIAGGGVAIVGGREAQSYNNDGGTDSWPTAVATFELYNPNGAGSFTNVPSPLPNPIARPNAVAWGGSIYVAGGTDVPAAGMSGGETADDGFYQETTTDNGGPQITWQPLDQVQDPSMGGGAVVMGHILYLVVGQTGTGPSDLFDTYDLTQTTPGDQWNTITFSPRPTARSYAAVVTDGNRLFVIGGTDGTNALTTVEEFDPINQWSTWPPLAVPVVDPRAAISSGFIFVIGGHVGTQQNCCQVPYVQTIDLRTGDVQLIGSTYQNLTNQAVVGMQSGNFFLFGAESLNGSTYTADSDVVQLTIPSL